MSYVLAIFTLVALASSHMFWLIDYIWFEEENIKRCLNKHFDFKHHGLSVPDLRFSAVTELILRLESRYVCSSKAWNGSGLDSVLVEKHDVSPLLSVSGFFALVSKIESQKLADLLEIFETCPCVKLRRLCTKRRWRREKRSETVTFSSDCFNLTSMQTHRGLKLRSAR